MDKKKLHDSDFELTNLPIEAQDPEIKAEDFVLENNENRTHEQKFQTKPTTFLKDSLKRFSKNKSSVVAAGILGGLLLLSVLVPIIDRNDTSSPHPEITYLEPKLLPAGTGFWDGTKKFEDIPVDVGNDLEGVDKENNWWPNPERFVQSAVSKKSFSDNVYSNTASKYGKEGYIAIGYNSKTKDEVEYIEFKTNKIKSAFNVNENHYLVSFDTYDSSKLAKVETQDNTPEGYDLGETAFYFNYFDSENNEQAVELVSYAVVHNIGSSVTELKEAQINISDKIKAALGTEVTSYSGVSFSVRLKNQKNHKDTCSLIKKIEFSSESSNEEFKKAFEAPSFTDATEAFLRESKVDSAANPAYWAVANGEKQIHMSKMRYCNFVYDPYEAKLGITTDNNFPFSSLDTYRRNKWINWKCITKKNPDTLEYEVDPTTFTCEIINKDKCPLVEPIKIEDINVDYDGTISFVKATVYQYKLYGYSRMPIFLFGTDKSGRDMFKYVFEGLRTSLVLGIVTTVVCFLFGLLYGAVSGYFGGTVDLVMERFTDILHGIPWIVVMTLVIIHMGSNFFTFALALCLTGWIGTASITRTQFYRFRGREYVLASRTLGASDARLIAKHILPNAMGTIITSAVLMVPGVIFSEATISYLGLGLKNLASLGVILSYNQTELQTNSYLLLFPSVVIALVMISFNLFGNGLRDAVNPSLKGEEE